MPYSLGFIFIVTFNDQIISDVSPESHYAKTSHIQRYPR